MSGCFLGVCGVFWTELFGLPIPSISRPDFIVAERELVCNCIDDMNCTCPQRHAEDTHGGA